MCGTKSITALIIQGTPTEEQLTRAWDDILQEYSDLTLTDKGNTIFDVWKKILYTQWKMTYVEHAVAFLKREYNPIIANRIVEVGFDLVVYVEDKEQYLKQIQAVETEALNLVVFLNQYTAEFKKLCPDTETPVTRTELDYTKELAILSRWYKNIIKPEEVTVFEVCGIIAAFNEYHKTNKNG